MPAKKPAKTTSKATTFAEQSVEELNAGLIAKRNDMLDYQRSLAAGELTNPRIITTTRKNIARIKTALRAAEQAGKGEK